MEENTVNEQLSPEENVEETQSLPLKSELLAQQKELEERGNELLKEMQDRTYSVDFGKVKVFNKLLKFLEKDAPWGHTTAAGLIMLYHNLRQEKEAVKANDWDGNVNIRSANVSILWQMLTKMTGTGFYEARDFVELMAQIGESISEAHNKVINDNGELRENHSKLAMIDQQLDEGRFEDDMPEAPNEEVVDEGQNVEAEVTEAT